MLLYCSCTVLYSYQKSINTHSAQRQYIVMRIRVARRAACPRVHLEAAAALPALPIRSVRKQVVTAHAEVTTPNTPD